MLLSSCVGVVEDASESRTESTEFKVQTDLAFNGIAELIPVAHDKLEVYFYPATGGSKEYLYQIYIGNKTQPINIVEAVMQKDYRSMFRYVITGLDIGTQYIVKVDVKDKNSNEVVVTDTTQKAYTFSNYVADFAGLSSVSNVSGISGTDSIRVRWPHATIYPGNLLGSKRDPDSYEITILDAALLTPKAFNDFNLGPDDGRIVKSIQYNATVNEAVIRGLVSGRIYYVNVRAVHKGTVDDPNHPELRIELNNKYFEIKTLEADAASITFDLDNYDLLPAPGANSKNSFRLNWGTITGIFDHFRVYYAISPALFPDLGAACAFKSAGELIASEISCKKVSSDLLATDLNDLATNQLFQVKLYVCITLDCSQYVELPILEETTGSQIAGFSGVQDVQLASRLEALGTVRLVYGEPDFSSGYFDGLAVEVTDQKPALLAWLDDPVLNPAPTTYIVTEDAYTGQYKPIPFDYKEDTFVTVQGIDYSSAKSYCFTMYPFVYDSLGNVVYKNENAGWSCATTKIITATKAQFEGVREAEVSGRQIFINWNLPTDGVYSHFEVFYKKAVSSADVTFSFDSAIEATTVNYDFSQYERVLVDKDAGYDSDGNPEYATFVSLLNMPTGYYNIGVLSFANMGDVVARSEKNLKIYQCYVDGTSTASCVSI